MNLIKFEGEIYQRKIESLLEALQHNPSSQVVLSSPGGTFEFFSSFAPALVRTGYTVVAHEVASAAIVLQLLAHRRFAVPSATFFFHEVRAIVGPNLEITIGDVSHMADLARQNKHLIAAEKRELLEEWERRMNMAQSWMLRFIQERTDLPQSTFLNLMRSEAVLTAREAKRYGIVHEIIEDPR